MATSEMRRAAKSLVEATEAEFPTAYGIPDSAARLRKCGLDAEITGDAVRIWERGRESRLTAARFEGRWHAHPEGALLTGEFLPSAGFPRFSREASIALTLLIAASIWVLFAGEPGTVARVLLPIVTLLTVLAFPLAIVALGSFKLAAESRIARAMQRALQQEA
jgi:hypothetical protein